MKKKTIRKVKVEKEKKETHWSAFDEPINGETKARGILDDLFNYVEQNPEALSLEHFLREERMLPSTFHYFQAKYPFFREGVELVKRCIYAKRLDYVIFEDKNAIILKDLYHFSQDHQDIDYLIDKRRKDDEEDRKKRLEEHASKLRTQEATVNPMAKVPHFIQGSDGQIYTGFNKPGKTLEEAECALKTYQESMTLNPDGTKSQS